MAAMAETSSTRRVAGVTVPLFSLRGPRSWGIGEIGDLPAFAQWLREAGIRLVQLLPLGEISGSETSPYAALTAFGILSVPVALLLVLFLAPMVIMASMSLLKFPPNGAGGRTLDHYTDVLTDPINWHIAWTTLWRSVIERAMPERRRSSIRWRSRSVSSTCPSSSSGNGGVSESASTSNSVTVSP